MANNNARGSVNPLGAALLGVAAGAAGAYLANKDNREKVKAKINEIKQIGSDKAEQVKDKLDDMEQKGKRKVSEALGAAQDKLDTAKDNAEKIASRTKRKVNQI